MEPLNADTTEEHFYLADTDGHQDNTGDTHKSEQKQNDSRMKGRKEGREEGRDHTATIIKRTMEHEQLEAKLMMTAGTRAKQMWRGERET